MRALSLAAIIALAAIPASAQQSGTSSGSQSQTGTQQQSQTQPGQQQDTQFTAMSKEKLRKTLEEAGFRQIQIVDATYTVRARTAEGNEVVMFIDPPSTTTGATGSTGSTPSGSGATKSK